MLTTVVPEPAAWDGGLRTHGRTPYEDDERPGHRRHLVRLWLRTGDRRRFRG